MSESRNEASFAPPAKNDPSVSLQQPPQAELSSSTHTDYIASKLLQRSRATSVEEHLRLAIGSHRLGMMLPGQGAVMPQEERSQLLAAAMPGEQEAISAGTMRKMLEAYAIGHSEAKYAEIDRSSSSFQGNNSMFLGRCNFSPEAAPAVEPVVSLLPSDIPSVQEYASYALGAHKLGLSTAGHTGTMPRQERLKWMRSKLPEDTEMVSGEYMRKMLAACAIELDDRKRATELLQRNLGR